jgi:hypothetical protein
VDIEVNKFMNRFLRGEQVQAPPAVAERVSLMTYAEKKSVVQYIENGVSYKSAVSFAKDGVPDCNAGAGHSLNDVEGLKPRDMNSILRKAAGRGYYYGK